MENNRKKVFVVENNLLERNMIKSFLKESGSKYDFKFFSNSAECIASLPEHPMAILIDYDLNTINPNEKDAIKILEEIKALENHTEVVFFSTHENTEIAVATIKHGAFDYIVINDNQFLRLENELKTIEEHVFHIDESKKFKKLFIITLSVSIIFILIVMILFFLGILKSGNGVWVEA
ncbi:MAG: response regulator [Cytophagales bacterium]